MVHHNVRPATVVDARGVRQPLGGVHGGNRRAMAGQGLEQEVRAVGQGHLAARPIGERATPRERPTRRGARKRRMEALSAARTEDTLTACEDVRQQAHAEYEGNRPTPKVWGCKCE